MKSNYEPLGKHIRLVDYRNSEEVTSTVLGISIDKEFMPSVANVIGTDLSRYKLISKGLFACNPMHVGRDERLPIALYEKDNAAIVSPAYFMFEIIDRDVLNEEYLMMWFRRPEFDRECWFMTDGSVRGGITWDDLCRIKLPVPSYARQCEIVESYRAITNRIALKRAENDNLVELCKTEFMRTFATHPEYRDEQSDWFSHPLGKSLSRVAMGPFGSNIKTDCFVNHGVPVLNGDNISGYLLSERSFRYVEDEKASQLKNSIAVSGDIVITHRGTLGQVALVPDKTKFDRYVISQSQFLLTCDQCALLPEYVLFYFHTDAGRRKLLANDNTTGVPSIAKPTSYIKALHIPIPPIELQQNWAVLVRATLAAVADNNLEMEKLTDFAQTLLSGLSR